MHAHFPNPSGAEAGLRDVAAALWRRRWVLPPVMTAFLGAGYAVSHSPRILPERYRSTGQLLVINRAASSAPDSVMAPLTAPTIETAETQLQMINGPAMQNETINWLKNQAYRMRKPLEELGGMGEDAIRQCFLNQDIRALHPHDTHLIVVEADAGSPADARFLADAVCSAFVEWRMQTVQEHVKRSVENLERRVVAARRDLRRLEQAEADYKRGMRLVDIPLQQQAVLKTYLEWDAEVERLQQVLAAEETRLRSIGSRLEGMNQALEKGTGVRNDQDVLSLQTRLNQLETEYTDAKLKYTPEYPGILPDLEAQIRDTRERLAKAIQATLDNSRPSLQSQGVTFEEYAQARTVVAGLRARLQAAIRLRDRVKPDTDRMPQVALGYARAVQDADVARTLYRDLKAAFSKVVSGKDMVDMPVVYAAKANEPVLPFQPDLPKNMLTGAILGLVTSLALAMWLDARDRRLYGLQDIKRVISGPIVALLPKLSSFHTRRLISGSVPSPVMDVYGMARANLATVMRRADLRDPWRRRVLLIASAVPGEGKSITAACLARSLARSGCSVALVDADLRHPTQNRLFNLDSSTGLADVLAGEASLNECLMKSGTENLVILPGGSPSLSPTDLLSRSRMKHILDILRSEVEVVVVDTPACSVVADALLVAPYADVILHVVQAGAADEETVSRAVMALRTTAPKVMAFFVNGVSRERRRYESRLPAYPSFSDTNGNGSRRALQPLSSVKHEETSGAEREGGTR